MKIKLKKKNKKLKIKVNTKVFRNFLFCTGVLLYLASFMFEKPMYGVFVALSMIFNLSSPVYYGIKKIKNGCVFNFDITIPVACVALFVLGDFYQAACCSVVFAIFKLIEYAGLRFIPKCRKIYNDVENKMYHYVRNSDDKPIKAVQIDEGDFIELFSGEIVPVDGYVKAGVGTVNQYAITGDSRIETKRTNDELLAGSTLLSGNVIIEAKSNFSDSSLGKTVNIIESTSKNETFGEKILYRILNIISAVILILGITVSIFIFVKTANFNSLKYGLALSLIACSTECLRWVLSLSYTNAIYRASQKGIVIPDKNFIENTLNIKTVLLGTRGVLSSKIPCLCEIKTEMDITESELVRFAAYAQLKNNNTVSRTIIAAAGEKIHHSDISSYEKLGEYGAKVTVFNNIEVVMGTSDQLKRFEIITGIVNDDCILCVAVNGNYVGYIKFEYQVREDARRCVDSLRFSGIKDIRIISEQSESTVKDILVKSGISQYFLFKTTEESEEYVRTINSKALFFRYGMSNVDLSKYVKEIKYDGFENYRRDSSVTVVDSLATPVAYINLLKDTKLMIIQQTLLAIFESIIAIVALIHIFTHPWLIVLFVYILILTIKFNNIRFLNKM